MPGGLRRAGIRRSDERESIDLAVRRVYFRALMIKRATATVPPKAAQPVSTASGTTCPAIQASTPPPTPKNTPMTTASATQIPISRLSSSLVCGMQTPCERKLSGTLTRQVGAVRWCKIWFYGTLQKSTVVSKETSIDVQGSAGRLPREELVGQLQVLHAHAGLPSSRAVAAKTGQVSHTTVAQALNGRRIPSWRTLMSIVQALDGDTEHFRGLWRALDESSTSEPKASGSNVDVAGTPPINPPAELPADVYGFVGRDGEIARLLELLSPPTGTAVAYAPTAVPIAVITGSAGVGKTALAVHLAHLIRSNFPDGQLYVDLRGYSPAGLSLAPGEVLVRILRSIGVDPSQMPEDIDERVALYRTLLTGRRILVVLDNAVSVEQIRPLIPGSPSCSVVVTSRGFLEGLTAETGATRVDLATLPTDDAVELLRRMIGTRADTDLASTVALAQRCAGLPLALRIVGSRLTQRPTGSLRDLIADLDQEQMRLNVLDAGNDPRMTVRSAFSWSYRSLSGEAKRLFALLGLHPTGSIDGYTAAALMNDPTDVTERATEELLSEHLLQAVSPSRSVMHDLLRAYAREKAQDLDRGDRLAALLRLTEYYLATASEAVKELRPAELLMQEIAEASSSFTRSVPSQEAAAQWLAAELPALLALADSKAHQIEERRHSAIEFSSVLMPYLYSNVNLEVASSLSTLAIAVAQKLNDRRREAIALRNLGDVKTRLGRDTESAHLITRALDLHRSMGDRIGEAAAVNSLGNIMIQLGQYDTAIQHSEAALALYREMDHRVGEAAALNSLGKAEARLGRYDAAVQHIQTAFTLYREVGDRAGEAAALNRLGRASFQMLRLNESLKHHTAAYSTAVANSNTYEEAIAHLGMAAAFGAEHKAELSRNHWQAAHELCTRLGIPDAEDSQVISYAKHP